MASYYLVPRRTVRALRRQAAKLAAQKLAWAEIELEITDAFQRQPVPDATVLFHWLFCIEQVRPDFRPTLARMCAHPAVLAARDPAEELRRYPPAGAFHGQ